MGGLRGRLQCCLIDMQLQSYCQGPSQTLEKQSTICTHCEQTNTPVQTHKMTGRNTQRHEHTQAFAEEEKYSILWLPYVSTVCAVSIDLLEERGAKANR